jgi:hypothetical protein
LHTNLLGAGAAGKAIADLIGPMAPPTTWMPLARDNSDSGNALSNALGLTDTNADGIPNYWACSSVTGLTPSLVATSAGENAAGIIGNWLTLTASSVAAASTAVGFSQSFNMTNNTPSTLQDGRQSFISPGDRVAFSCWVKSSGLSGPAAITAYLYSRPSFTYARVYGLIYPIGSAGKIYLEYTVPTNGDTFLEVDLSLERSATLPNSTNIPNMGSTASAVLSFAMPITAAPLHYPGP